MNATLAQRTMSAMSAFALLASTGLAVQAQEIVHGTPKLVPVDARSVRATVTLGGTVVPFRDVTLAAQLPGRVVYLAGEEGDAFDEGAMLAKLDEKELRAQQQSAYAALRDAEVSMRNAGIQYSRELIAPQRSSPSQFGGMGMPALMDQWFSRPMGSMMGYGNPWVERGADLYTQGAQVEQARNAHLRAQAQLRQIDAKFRDIRSISPFDGVITKKFVEVGDTVQPGQPMLEFADTEYLQVQVEVPARLMPGVRKDMVVRSKLDVGDRLVNVRVQQIFPLADPERHTVRVKFDLPTGAPAAPGMYAEVMVPDVNAPVREVLVIPSAAIEQRGSLPMVRVDREGRRELHIVRLGEYVDPFHVTVLSGLRPGDFVVVTSAQPGGGQGRPIPGRPSTPLPMPRY